MKGLLGSFPNVDPNDILFVTSRSMTIDQQSKEENISKFSTEDVDIVKYWNGLSDDPIYKDASIKIMNYGDIACVLQKMNNEGFQTLSKAKIIVFDECHTIFSDLFISGMNMLQVWIREALYTGDKIIVGMTATPDIIEYYQNTWGVSTVRLNEQPVVKYKSQQLYCTDFETLPYLINKTLKGRTIIMCYSVADCFKLQEQIPDSFVLISRHNSKFTKEMNRVREYIVENEDVPSGYIDGNGDIKLLNVLITTSTMREGINIREHSGIKNVVCCFTDELHIVQFAGRCRYNIDNLVVANTFIRSHNQGGYDYSNSFKRWFLDFMDGRSSVWFEKIKHIVDHDVDKAIKIRLGESDDIFREYIDSEWLSHGATSRTAIIKRGIFGDDRRGEFLEQTRKHKVMKGYPSKITFNKAIKFVQEVLGYKVDTGSINVDGKTYAYKLIVGYNHKKNKYTQYRKEGHGG